MAWNEGSAAERIRGAAPALLVHILLGLALIYGLAGDPTRDAAKDEIRSFDVLPEPLVAPSPPPPTPSPLRRAEPSPAPRAEGASSPPNREAQPLPLEAPKPIVQPPPAAIPAAPLAGTGAATSAGAAPVAGPGTGAGGAGTGAGSGTGGNGTGGGGNGGGGLGDGGGPIGDLSPPRQVAGALSIRDMPEPLRESGFTGTVGVIYRVEPDGRVTNCRITHRSGSALMDQTTCRLIEQRFRFRPARDERGRPFAGDVYEDHRWESDAPPPDRRRRRDEDDD